jgi:BirA family biotin operon repressor/biotin-[acetyl-CoA-carboxylase] ligase
VALEKGEGISRTTFTRALLRHLDSLYELYLEAGFPPLLKAWEAYFDLIGRQVEVDYQNRCVQGRVEGLDDDGALLLRLPDGRSEKVLAGDVRPL